MEIVYYPKPTRHSKTERALMAEYEGNLDILGVLNSHFTYLLAVSMR